MGLFSSRNKAKNITYNTIDVKPTTNVDVDVDVDIEAIANAIKNSSDKQLTIEQIKIALAKAGLEFELQKHKLENQKANIEFLQDEKTRNQLTILALIIGGFYIYKKMKKG